jgi:hypothetical protein
MRHIRTKIVIMALMFIVGVSTEGAFDLLKDVPSGLSMPSGPSGPSGPMSPSDLNELSGPELLGGSPLI